MIIATAIGHERKHLWLGGLTRAESRVTMAQVHFHSCVEGLTCDESVWSRLSLFFNL